MKLIIERRRDPRVAVDWPVVVLTPKGAIKGKTVNISVSGLALLLFSEMPDVGDEFQITLKPSEDHEMLITCEKIWSDLVNLDGSFRSGIGVQFTKISSRDRKTIASLLKTYQPF